MSTQRAVVHKKDGAELRSDVPLPRLRDDYITIKTKYIALNPTDWKSIKTRNTPGTVAGCDYAGIVEEVGKAVNKSLKKGDRVAGYASGANIYENDKGSFAQHITAKGDILLKVADSVPLEQASTLGVGIATVGQGLFQSLGLPLPPNKVSAPTSILIYGASTATGTLAVQYAKLVGATVYATASPKNHDLVKSLGADHVFDYHASDVGNKIREASNDSIKLAFDTISEGSSPGICAAALSSQGGHYSALQVVKEFPRDDVRRNVTVAYTALGEKFNDAFPQNDEDFAFGKKFWALSEDLINDGTIKPHPIELRGGIEDIVQGLEDLKNGQASAKKFVYKIE